MTIRAPYLIQRAEIESPLAMVSTRLSQAVNFDYMGSAEFEFGALPKSFRRMEANKAQLILRKVPEIMEGEIPLRVYSYLTNEEFEQYKGYLLRLRNPTPSTRLNDRHSCLLTSSVPCTGKLMV